MSHMIDLPSKDELVGLYSKNGTTISSLSKHYNTSQPTVRKWLIQYGIDRKTHQEASSEANNRKRNNPPSKEILLEQYKKHSIDWLETHYGVGQSTIYYWLSLYDIKTGERLILTSEAQRKIFQALKERDPEGEWQMGNRTLIYPQEIDIVSNKRKIAIEYCGLYWHSELRKSADYHQDKMKRVESQGYKLYTVFESDDQQKSIDFILPRNMTVGARTCSVECDVDVYQFENTHHIMGACPASIKLALVHDGNIVSSMTFSKSRYSKKAQWEIVRYTVGRTAVIGGAKKLFQFFVRNYNPESVVSYCDRRYGSGNVYQQLGFNMIGSTKPNYWYFKLGQTRLLSRQGFQKHTLAKKLTTFDPAKTERQNMMDNKYIRIYDCGSTVWLYTKSSQKDA